MLGALNMIHSLVVDLEAAETIEACDNMNKTPKDLAQERGHHQIVVKIDYLLRGDIDETSSNEDDHKQFFDDGRFMDIEGFDKPTSFSNLAPNPNAAKNTKNATANLEIDYERKSGESSSEEEENRTEKVEDEIPDRHGVTYFGEGSELEFQGRTAERQKKQLDWEEKRKKFQKTRDLELQRMIVKRQELVVQEELVKNHKKKNR